MLARHEPLLNMLGQPTMGKVAIELGKLNVLPKSFISFYKALKRYKFDIFGKI